MKVTGRNTLALEPGDLVVPIDSSGNRVGPVRAMLRRSRTVGAWWDPAELTCECGDLLGYQVLLGHSTAEPGRVVGAAYAQAVWMPGDGFGVVAS